MIFKDTDLIQLDIKDLQCDAAGCDYYDAEARFEDYPLYVNKPCPKCGANLLTEADMKTCNRIVKLCGFINKIGRFFGFKRKPTDEVSIVEGSMNGTGKINLKERKEPNNMT